MRETQRAFSEKSVRTALSKFSCRDEGVTDFIHNKAIDFDSRNAARTYLVINDEAIDDDAFEFVAYFTLSMKTLELDSRQLSKSFVKRVHGFSNTAKSTEAILIGQLGKDALHGANIAGKTIMDYALRRVRISFNNTGGRVAMLECQHEQKLIDFYKSNSFVPLQTNDESGLFQMVRFL